MIKLADDLSSGDHVCAIPDSEEHLSELSAQFVAEGLHRDEKVFYYDDDGAADAMLRRLEDDGAPVEAPLSSGQLTIVPEQQTRATFRTPLGELYRGVTATVTGALQEGYRGTRLTGQMHSSLAPGASASLPEFDGLLDRLLSENRLTALCTYDHGHYSTDQIEIMRALHRDHLAPVGAYDDGLMRIVRTGVASARLAGEVDHSNRSKITTLLQTSLDRALRASDGSPDVVLDMASVRFIDVATAVGLVHAAETFPATHRLVLHRVRPRVQRILDRCGAPFASQLHVAAEDGDAR
ncbi:MAG: MEDS domain-containing protein [Actinomycetota bacterium]|nr:MEDS domain-containing protein [Actinomycetota bacterium]